MRLFFEKTGAGWEVEIIVTTDDLVGLAVKKKGGRPFSKRG